MKSSQTALLAFVRSFRATHPYGPSYRQVAAALGVSPQAVHQKVEAMKVAGLVRHDPSVARSLDINQVAKVEKIDTL